ncbi:MAG: DUF4230 domain-containing protein [Polyangiaceae bacterium]
MHRWAVLVASGVLASGGVVGAFYAGRASTPPPPREPEYRATPGLITAIHDVARLETTSFHVEKVVEMTDTQAHLWGLVQAKDDLLLIAAGDVVAGVDLTKVRDEDVVFDPATRSVRVKMPRPEVLSSAIDEQATHAYSRHTDTLARRNEQLEGDARRNAEEQMRKQAVEAGILDRARASADKTLRALLTSLGCTHIDLDWQDRG